MMNLKKKIMISSILCPIKKEGFNLQSTKKGIKYKYITRNKKANNEGYQLPPPPPPKEKKNN